MAGRVNTRFVITLSAVLVLVFGGLLGAALWIKLHNAPELMRKGDVKMESGKALLASGKVDEAMAEFEAAEKIYSKAVNKEQMNPVYLQRWIDSLQAWVPESQSRLGDAFQQKLIPCYRQIAIAKKTDVAAHREYLNLLYKLNRLSPNRRGAEHLISEVDRSLLMFRGNPLENGEAQTLRRYRGLIITSMMNSRGMELSPEQVELAREDLEAAHKADPKDSESAVAVASWYDARARMALTNNKPEAAAEFDAKARATIDAFVAAHPDDLTGALRQVYTSVYEGQKKIRENSRSTREDYEAGRALAEKLRPQYQQLCAMVKSRAGDMTLDQFGFFQELEGFFDMDPDFTRSRECLRAMIEKNPDTPEPYLALASILSDRDSIDQAIPLLQKIVDMKARPVGFEGVQLYNAKSQALYLQAVYAFQQWENESDKKSEKAKAALDASHKYRAEMARYVGSDSELLVLVDGFHRFAEADWLGAKKLLGDYLRRTQGQNIKAEWTLAQCEIRLRNTGAALEMLDRIVRSRPDISGPVIQKAALLGELGRTQEAVALLTEFISLNPKNQDAKNLLERIQITAGNATPADPVEAALLRAKTLTDGTKDTAPDAAAAAALLQEEIAKKSDPRLHQMLASIKLEQGDQKGAIQVLEAAVAAHPDSKDLAIILDGVKSEDPVAWRVKQIDDAKDVPEVERLLGKYALWNMAADNALASAQADKEAKWRSDADAALDAARKLAPDDQRVVDRVFTRALLRKDWTTGEKLVEQAASKDYDHVGGAMYKGRLLYARGQLSEAGTVLREAADKGIADVASLRLLAIIYQQMGRTDDAETYFKEAIKLRPGDSPTIVMYLNLLSSTGRAPEALAKAKELEPAARTSPDFINALLNLEASVGDLKTALARRDVIHKKDPRNIANTLALVNLQIEAKQWKEARALLDELRTVGDGADLAIAEARFYAEQNDFAAATKAMDDFLARQDPKNLKYDTFITLGRFLIDRKKYPEGIAMMQRGEKYQDPKVMEVDRAIAETLVQIGQPDEGVKVLRHIVDSGADSPRQEVRIRLAELYSALTPTPLYKEAQEQLDQVKPPTEVPVQTQVLLIRAEVAHGLKDDKKAAELFNQAVVQFPNDPMVYFRRAQFHLARGPAGAGDALQDLDAAIRVRSNFWQARRLRSFIYSAMGGDDNFKRALDDVKETLRINPSLDDLRLQLCNELITRERTPEAAEIADAAIKLRPNDVPLAMNLGQTFADGGEWGRATDYYRVGWTQSGKRRPDIAQLLLNAMLNSPEPNLAEVEEILRDVQKIETVDRSGKRVDPILNNWGLLLARAKLHMKRNRTQEALKDIMVSMTAISTPAPNAETVGAWAQEVRRLLPRPAEEVDLLTRKDVPAPFFQWSIYLRASILAESTSTRAQAIALLDDLLAKSKDPDIRRLSYRVRGTIEFLDGHHPAAESLWRKGVEEFPDDWELNNNLAYVLCRHLDRCQDALPFAERAGKGAKGIAEAVDTFGYTLLRVGKTAEAEMEFKKALALARSNSTRVSVGLHLSRCLLDQNKKELAKVQLENVRRIMQRDLDIEKNNKEEFDELNRRLGSP